MAGSIARVLTLLEVLQGGGTHTLRSLRDRLGVDERTVRRYIGHLLDLEVPVESVRGRYGGYRVAPGFRLPPLMLTDDEALAVLLGLTMDASSGDAAENATAKILRVLPVASRARFEALMVTADLGPPRPSVERPDTDLLLAVAQAAGERTPLLLRYTDREGRGSHRIVLPYGIVARSGRWYLSGEDSLSGEVRTFRLDRISGLEPKDGAFEVPPEFDAGASVRAALATTPWRYAVSARVQATAQYVTSRLPDGLATITELDAEPGWVRVELRAQRLDWLPAMLAGLDRPFAIDAPAELREATRRLGERLLDAAEQGTREAGTRLSQSGDGGI